MFKVVGGGLVGREIAVQIEVKKFQFSLDGGVRGVALGTSEGGLYS